MAIEGPIAKETDNRIPEPYKDEEYKQYRASWLGTIPKSNVLQFIRSNFAQVNFVVASAVIATIATGMMHIPVIGLAILGATSVACAAISAYAGYLDEKMSKTTDKAYSEARQIVDSRVQGQGIANAIRETLGEELKDARAENRQTQEALVKMQQHMQSWQEREAAREPDPRVLH